MELGDRTLWIADHVVARRGLGRVYVPPLPVMLLCWLTGNQGKLSARNVERRSLLGLRHEKKKKKKGMKKEEKLWGGRFSRYSSPPFTLTLIVRSYRSLADNERGRDRITRTRKLGALLEWHNIVIVRWTVTPLLSNDTVGKFSFLFLFFPSSLRMS